MSPVDHQISSCKYSEKIKYQCCFLHSLLRLLLPPLDHLLKLLMIIRMIGAHDAVPDIEVKAEIAIDIAVVHGVVGGGIAPQSMDAPREAAPEKFIACMTAHIQHELVHAP